MDLFFEIFSPTGMNTIELETHSISIKTQGNCDIIDITSKAKELISKHGFTEGNIILFAGGSTAGITTIEYEPGLLKDYPKFFDRIAPMNVNYEHDNTWHDGNGHSHIRASIQGASLTVPFSNGSLLLGAWQQIIFIDFDNRPRRREITIQITGKKK
ncbi:MAG TPA: secondary thiamine-phosphate synthase enzyme YjbQ [Ignavibacteriaceae bacterium]|nr:secondary thiamine-phosphate synthase enzyme YjbQ [Ignavibacteriaceae bacterium]